MDIAGKTVATAKYSDPWDEGMTIVFTDGTVLKVRERTQSGEIEVFVNDNAVDSDWQN
jgi:hypothetical protein